MATTAQPAGSRAVSSRRPPSAGSDVSRNYRNRNRGSPRTPSSAGSSVASSSTDPGTLPPVQSPRTRARRPRGVYNILDPVQLCLCAYARVHALGARKPRSIYYSFSLLRTTQPPRHKYNGQFESCAHNEPSANFTYDPRSHLVRVLQRAYCTASTRRRGPVWLSLCCEPRTMPMSICDSLWICAILLGLRAASKLGVGSSSTLSSPPLRRYQRMRLNESLRCALPRMRARAPSSDGQSDWCGRGKLPPSRRYGGLKPASRWGGAQVDAFIATSNGDATRWPGARSRPGGARKVQVGKHCGVESSRVGRLQPLCEPFNLVLEVCGAPARRESSGGRSWWRCLCTTGRM